MNSKELGSARVQLHYAIQFMAAAGSALVPFAEDYSHTALNWNPTLKLFTSPVINGKRPFQLALEPTNLTALILNSRGKTLASLSLDQQTFEQGLSWLKTQLSRLGTASERVVPLTYPPNSLPDCPIAHGAAFEADSEASQRQLLVSYYDISLPVLQMIEVHNPDASPVRIWPHHFDMATLIALPTPEEEERRSVGVGFSPGDAEIPEPYWYVTPWPSPSPDHFPPLRTKGVWRTGDWFGAVLLSSELGDLEDNKLDLGIFLTVAIALCKQILMGL